jgi:hypothetical protein
LSDFAEDIAALRRAAIAAAEPLDLGIVAAGTVPLADHLAPALTTFRHMVLTVLGALRVGDFAAGGTAFGPLGLAAAGQGTPAGTFSG